MKMYTLLKKDLLLAGDYFWLSPACAIGVPVFLRYMAALQQYLCAADRSQSFMLFSVQQYLCNGR